MIYHPGKYADRNLAELYWKQSTVLNSAPVPGGSRGNVEVRPRLTSQALAPQCKTHPNAQFGELKEPCVTLEQKAEHT